MTRSVLPLAAVLIALAAPPAALAQDVIPPPPVDDPSVVVVAPETALDPGTSPDPIDPAEVTGDILGDDPVEDDVPEEEPEPPLVTTATVPGRTALMRTDGKAAIPRGAPKRVRAVIAAANLIIGKPYKWGGGHAKLTDRGYDCSGAVSFALIRAGLLASPQVSGTLAHWAAKGAGRWMTVYANRGHVYLEVAGLRLDTSGVGDWGGRSGVRWRPVIGGRPRFAQRHVLGL